MWITKAKAPHRCEYPLSPNTRALIKGSVWFCPKCKTYSQLTDPYYGTFKIIGTASEIVKMRLNNEISTELYNACKLGRKRFIFF